MYDIRVSRIKENEDFIKVTLIALMKQIIVVGCGFFASSASLKELSPFGTALCACVIPEYIPAAVLGSAIGYFYVYDVTILTLRYIASGIVCGIISFVVKRGLKAKFHRYAGIVASFVSILGTGLVLSMSVTVSADEFVLYFAEGVISAAGVWFFSEFLQINPTKRCASRLTVSETAGVLVVFALSLLSLGSFSVFSVSPCVVASVYVVLASSTYGGEKFSALFGIVASVVLDIILPHSFLTGSIALGGLLSGIFGRKNKVFASFVFALTVFMAAFTSDDWINAVYIVTGIGAGCVLFLVTPKKITDVFRNVFAVSASESFLSGQKKILGARLRTASEGMENVTNSVKAVAGIYRRRSAPKEENICKNTGIAVCSKCKNYEYCWDKNYARTKGYFADIIKELKSSDSAVNRELPVGFSAVCRYSEQIVKSLSFELERYRSAMRESAKTGETVNIVSDQFLCVSELLSAFADDVEFCEDFDEEKTAMVYDVLVNDFGSDVHSAGVFRLENNRIYCQINISDEKRINRKKLIKSVEDVLGKKLEKEVVNTNSDGTLSITMCEQTKYRIETGGYQISSDGSKWCGDSFDSFSDGKGNFYMILSDGMGTGKKAAADSVMCSSLASILLRAGYPVECILKMINSAMLVRSGEESLATLDIAVMNLYTGEVNFYKAGAAHSVALKHQKLLKISKPSLPVGILGNVKFEEVSLSVADGDAVVLVSDGVSEDVLPSWKNILADSDGMNGTELADRLAKSAHINSDKNSPDDITVVVAKVKKQ